MGCQRLKLEVLFNLYLKKKNYGTHAYIALEVLRAYFLKDGSKAIEVSAFQAYVYLFAMLCANILSQNNSLFNLNMDK